MATHEERTSIILSLLNSILDLFKNEIPHDIMKETTGTMIMIDTTLNLLFQLGKAANYSNEEIVQLVQKLAYKLNAHHAQIETSTSNTNKLFN